MSAATPDSTGRSFDRLVTAIGQAHAELAGQAARAVDSSLMLRNWLSGFYIAEYEQQGTDRPRYTDRLIERLSERLIQAGISRSETAGAATLPLILPDLPSDPGVADSRIAARAATEFLPT